MKETLKVQGLSCNCCVNKVEESVNKLAGISSIEVNQASEEVQVTFDENTITLEQIEAKIAEQGYQVV